MTTPETTTTACLASRLGIKENSLHVRVSRFSHCHGWVYLGRGAWRLVDPSADKAGRLLAQYRAARECSADSANIRGVEVGGVGGKWK